MDDKNHTKYKHLFHHINKLRMKDVRLLFAEMRQVEGCSANVLFPSFGFTVGEFTVAYTYDKAKTREK